jgi:hypothetical protein
MNLSGDHKSKRNSRAVKGVDNTMTRQEIAWKSDIKET